MRLAAKKEPTATKETAAKKQPVAKKQSTAKKEAVTAVKKEAAQVNCHRRPSPTPLV